MSTQLNHRLQRIARLAQINVDELSLVVNHEARPWVKLSEERRRAIQELLGMIQINGGTSNGSNGKSQADAETPEVGNTAFQKQEEDVESETAHGAIQVHEETSELKGVFGVWLTLNQVASILQVNPLTVRRWLYAGEIAGIGLPGRGYRIKDADLASFITKHYRIAGLPGPFPSLNMDGNSLDPQDAPRNPAEK